MWALARRIETSSKPSARASARADRPNGQRTAEGNPAAGNARTAQP